MTHETPAQIHRVRCGQSPLSGLKGTRSIHGALADAGHLSLHQSSAGVQNVGGAAHVGLTNAGEDLGNLLRSRPTNVSVFG